MNNFNLPFINCDKDEQFFEQLSKDLEQLNREIVEQSTTEELLEILMPEKI